MFGDWSWFEDLWESCLKGIVETSSESSSGMKGNLKSVRSLFWVDLYGERIIRGDCYLLMIWEDIFFADQDEDQMSSKESLMLNTCRV